jgi:hypothetical protein
MGTRGIITRRSCSSPLASNPGSGDTDAFVLRRRRDAPASRPRRDGPSLHLRRSSSAPKSPMTERSGVAFADVA